MQEPAQHTPDLGERLRQLASQLNELAQAVGEQERRQQERDRALQLAVSQITALSSNLHALVEPEAPSQPPAESASPAPESPTEPASEQTQHTEGEWHSSEQQAPRWG